MKKNKQKELIHYDRKSDSLYIGFKAGAEEEFMEVVPGVAVEFDLNGHPIGVEILNASKILKPISKQLERSFIKPQEVFAR